MEQNLLLKVTENEALRAELQSLKLQVETSVAPLRRFLMRASLSNSFLRLVRSRIEADLPSYSSGWIALQIACKNHHFHCKYRKALESLGLQEQQIHHYILDAWVTACRLPLPKLPPTLTALLEQVGVDHKYADLKPLCQALYL